MADNDIDIAKLQENVKTIFKRMDEIQTDVKAMQSIATSVERLAHSVETMTKNMENMSKEIESIKAEPSTAWKNFKWIIIGVITTTIVGVLINAVLSNLK